VLQGGVGGQDGVVGLHHCCRHLRQWRKDKCISTEFLAIHVQTINFFY
jgi:hypothetical protein